MRPPLRSTLAAAAAVSVAAALTITLPGTAAAAISSQQVWEDDSLIRPAFSTSGDILGDARPELVVTDYGNYQVVAGEPVLAPGAMYIFTNDAPEGTTGPDGLDDWERITVFDETAGITFPSQPLLADIDGDGDIDILHGGGFFWDSDAGDARGTLTWWENADGDGRSWDRHTIVDASPWAYHNVQFADLDGDGIDDIVTVGEQGMTKETYEDDLTELQFYKGLGGGSFAPKVALADRGGSSPVAFDVDGDGDLDVVSAQYFHVSPLVQNAPPGFPPGDGSFVWFENTSNGTDPLTSDDFVKHEISRGQGPSFGIYPVEDFYGDGVTRYVGVNHTNTTPGTPGPPVTMQADPNAFVLTPGADPTEPWDVVELADSYDEGARWAAEQRPGQAAPGKVAFGDFDGDGDLDLVISGDGDFRAMLIEQTAPGVFHQSVLPGSEGWGQAGVTVNDFDGDGGLEVALSSFENQTLGMWSLADAPEAQVTAVHNGDQLVPSTHGTFVRAGDLLTVSSGNNDAWVPGVSWRATLCTDAAGTSCAPAPAESSLWAGSPAPYDPATGAPVGGDGVIEPTRLRLASAATFTGVVHLKIYQGDLAAVMPINLITDERTVGTTMSAVEVGSALPFVGAAFYPGETVTVTTSAAGAASATVVADAAGGIGGAVLADRVGTVRVVATGIGGGAESGEVTVSAAADVDPPTDGDTPDGDTPGADTPPASSDEPGTDRSGADDGGPGDRAAPGGVLADTGGDPVRLITDALLLLLVGAALLLVARRPRVTRRTTP